MNNTKSVRLREKDIRVLGELKDRLDCRYIYQVVSKLIEYYERLEYLKHRLGCESIEHLFYILDEKLPKTKKQVVVSKTNQYIEDLRRLDIPRHVLDKLSDTIYKIIFDEW